MFERGSHYVAFGSTDQQSLRQLTAAYDGVMVPGTIAAYQADGTQGFILSLSAMTQKPYVIDPRTPLFQVPDATIRPSHISLAETLDLGHLLAGTTKMPSIAWDPPLARRAAEAWAAFNLRFTSVQPPVFAKYRKRLGAAAAELTASTATGPEFVLAPYLMEGQPGAADINDLLWEATVNALRDTTISVRRVVATESPDDLAQTVARTGQAEVAIWVNNMNELETANGERLASYARAIRMSSKDHSLFALYGGYFSVLLGKRGLAGASHGVGFSEHRNYRELASSGAAPARFYIEPIHRFLNKALASELWRADPGLVAGTYPEYELGRDPLEYSHHELMAHSLRCRSAEVRFVDGSSEEACLAQLNGAFEAHMAALPEMRVARETRKRLDDAARHLPMWHRVLEATQTR